MTVLRVFLAQKVAFGFTEVLMAVDVLCMMRPIVAVMPAEGARLG
jgi:hypothetical protein